MIAGGKRNKEGLLSGHRVSLWGDIEVADAQPHECSTRHSPVYFQMVQFVLWNRTFERLFLIQKLN